MVYMVAWHIQDYFMFSEEEKIHGNREEALCCMRKKGHSSKEMALCLDHIQPAGKLKRIEHALQKPINWILERDNCMAKILAILIMAAWPIVRITLYTWDFSKDTAMVVYLCTDRWQIITSPMIHSLIVVYAISVLASSLVVCFAIQSKKENGVIKISKINNGPLRRLVRLLLLLLTPITPILISHVLCIVNQ